MHVCITLRFAGTRYHGFQVQKNALAVCEVLQNALEQPVRRAAAGERMFAHGCGCARAWRTVSVTRSPSRFDPHKLPLAVNRFLAGRCTSDGARTGVPEDFHARYTVRSARNTSTACTTAPWTDPFQNARCAGASPGPLDARRQDGTGGAVPCGKTRFCVVHDPAGSDIDDTVRTVYFAHVRA